MDTDNSLMDRVRAAAMILPERRKNEQLEMDAFMSVFHPEHDRIIIKDGEEQ